jgi:hypothetical protein
MRKSLQLVFAAIYNRRSLDSGKAGATAESAFSRFAEFIERL